MQQSLNRTAVSSICVCEIKLLFIEKMRRRRWYECWNCRTYFYHYELLVGDYYYFVILLCVETTTGDSISRRLAQQKGGLKLSPQCSSFPFVENFHTEEHSNMVSYICSPKRNSLFHHLSVLLHMQTRTGIWLGYWRAPVDGNLHQQIAWMPSFVYVYTHRGMGVK